MSESLNVIEVSNDLSFMAVYENSGLVKVFNISDSQNSTIAVFDPNYHGESGRVKSMSFSTKNDLYIATEKGSFFKLTPSPCGQLQENVNSVCGCKANTTQI